MKLVIKENKIEATYCDNQPVETYEEYKVGYEFKTVADNSDYKPGDDYEETQEQIDKMQALKNITKRQLLIWLYIHKQKTEENIFTAIATIEDSTNRYLGEKSYTGTNTFEYGNPFVPIIWAAMGLTTAELKQCFDEAASM